MNSEEFRDLWVPVSQVFYPHDDASSSSWGRDGPYDYLDKELGVTEWHDYSRRPANYDTPMPSELHEFLRSLLGPHSRTLLKAYQAKHGIKPRKEISG